jgi:hypothetical protein
MKHGGGGGSTREGFRDALEASRRKRRRERRGGPARSEAVEDITKIETGARLPYTSTCSNDGEALRQGPALEAPLTHVCVNEDLTSDMEQHEGGGEGAYTPLKLRSDVLWATRMGNPQLHSHSKNNKTPDIYLNTYYGNKSELEITMAADVQSVRKSQDCYIQITTVGSRQNPNAEYTVAEYTVAEYTVLNIPFRTHCDTDNAADISHLRSRRTYHKPSPAQSLHLPISGI